MKIKQKDLRELRRIQDSIPKEWRDKLIMKRAITPTMARVIELGLRDASVSSEVKEKLRTIKESGLLHQKEDVVNQTVQKKIDQYVEREIERSIAAGRLSPKAKNHDKGLQEGV